MDEHAERHAENLENVENNELRQRLQLYSHMFQDNVNPLDAAGRSALNASRLGAVHLVNEGHQQAVHQAHQEHNRRIVSIWPGEPPQPGTFFQPPRNQSGHGPSAGREQAGVEGGQRWGQDIRGQYERWREASLRIGTMQRQQEENAAIGGDRHGGARVRRQPGSN